MLKYNHAFNTTDLTQPFHVHQISSDTKEVKIHINSKLIGAFRPNGLALSDTNGQVYTRYLDLKDEDIFNLVVSGSRATYGTKIEESIFNDRSIIYVKNNSGKMLFRDPDTDKYSWEEDKRSRFFFNPYYFDSKNLWNLKLGYVPTGIICQDQWPDLEYSLFTSLYYTTNLDWQGSVDIQPVEPMTVSYYNRATTGYASSFRIDRHLDIPHVVDGDHVLITNGKESLEFDVSNSGETIVSYPTVTITNRPIIHVPLQFINPNELYHFAKPLDRGTQEVIHKVINDIDIQFKIVRT